MPTWIFYALLSAIAAAAVAIFGKIGVAGIDSTLATAVRSVIMAAFLITLIFATDKIKLLSTINSRAFLAIVAAGIAGALSWLFYFYALQNGPASGVAALDRLSVVFVLVFAVLLLGEKLTWQSALGAILITIGAILMSRK